MATRASRAARLPKYLLTNVSTDRESPDWMDGISTLDIECFPKFLHVIPEPLLAPTNIPPFYRLLSDEQTQALLSWSNRGNISKELLGLYWPGDFNGDGKLKRNRRSWKIGDYNTSDESFVFWTYQSSGRPMQELKSLRLSSANETDSKKRKDRTPDKKRPSKVVLLNDDNKNSEKILELELEIDQLKASLKHSQARAEGLSSQVEQIETAMTVRSELVTYAIVNYHMSLINLRMLSPAISSLTDQSISEDDISEAAGGPATLDYRIRVVKEVAKKLSIPIAITLEGEDSQLFNGFLAETAG